jgi:hypothetical protein
MKHFLLLLVLGIFSSHQAFAISCENEMPDSLKGNFRWGAASAPEEACQCYSIGARGEKFWYKKISNCLSLVEYVQDHLQLLDFHYVKNPELSSYNGVGVCAAKITNKLNTDSGGVGCKANPDGSCPSLAECSHDNGIRVDVEGKVLTVDGVAAKVDFLPKRCSWGMIDGKTTQFCEKSWEMSDEPKDLNDGDNKDPIVPIDTTE